MSYDYLFKYVIIGDTGVGKTAICERFVENKYTYNSQTTLGVDFKTNHIKLHDNSIIKLHIWDTAGHGKFQNIISHYYKNMAGVILVYDVCDRCSFNKLKYWLEKIYINKTPNIDVKIILVGNKVDGKSREVTTEEGEQFASGNNLLYHECSAKMGYNVNELFKKLTNTIYEELDDDMLHNSSGIRRHFSFNDDDCLKRTDKSKGIISRMCCTII